MNPAIKGQEVWVALLFHDGPQITDHFKAEVLECQLVLWSQPGEMIRTEDKPPLNVTIIDRPVAAEISKIDGSGEW